MTDWQPEAKGYSGIAVTDLDGTLLSSEDGIAREDLETLASLEGFGCLRVVATGRSLFSFLNRMGTGLPIDFLIFSSGAGIQDYKRQRLIRKLGLEPPEVREIAGLLFAANVDFMLHAPIPDNHRFLYHSMGAENRDFARRCARYSEYCRPLAETREPYGFSSQFVAIQPRGRGEIYDALRTRLSRYTVLRTTSPLDGSSMWIEILPLAASKGKGTAWLAERFGLGPEDALALGNDYNDTDLLEWSGASYVVSGAPSELARSFREVSSPYFTRAVRHWQETRGA
jgi:HAD superfamily hydrolase (TIGR01484 family)